jgi:hypothetical protein
MSGFRKNSSSSGFFISEFSKPSKDEPVYKIKKAAEEERRGSEERKIEEMKSVSKRKKTKWMGKRKIHF